MDSTHRIRKSAVAALALGLVITAHLPVAEADTLLFSDNFNRASGEDLNVSTNGKSGLYASATWDEAVGGNGLNGMMITNNILRQEYFNKGAVWVDHNFVGLKRFTVSLDLVDFDSNGTVRHAGFGVGQSYDEIQLKTGFIGEYGPADVFVSLPRTSSPGVYVFTNGVMVAGPIGAVSYPDTLSATFTYRDMNAGTVLNYEIFINGASVHSGSTKWSGTDENYIFIQGSATDYTDFDNFAVTGLIRPPQGTVVTLY